MSFNLEFRFIVLANFFIISLSFSVVSFENRLYYIDNTQPLSWAGSLAKCMERGLQMVNANTKSINDFLKAVTNKNKDYWLGLVSFEKLITNVPGASLNSTYETAWYSPLNELIFTDWCANEPSQGELSSILSKKKCWKNRSYNTPSYTICEDKTVKPSNSINFQDKIYYFYNQKGASFFDAYRICTDNNQNLASTDDKQLSIQIIKKAKKANYWIGLKSFGQYGFPVSKWHWNSTGKDLTYTNWCAPQTYNSSIYYKYSWCGYIDVGEKCWKPEVCDRDFGKVHGFICESKNDKGVTASVTTSIKTTTARATKTKNPITYAIITKVPTTNTIITKVPTTNTIITKVPTTNTIITKVPTTTVASMKNYDTVNFDGIPYYFYVKKVSQADANAECRRNGQNLISIDNAHLVAFIKAEVRKRKKSYWIGTEAYTMVYRQKEYIYWRWNNTGLDIYYSDWCPGQTIAKDLVCSFINAADKRTCWKFLQCAKANCVKGFICEDKINHTDDYDIVMYGGYEHFVYKTNRNNISWYEARDVCRNNNKQMLTLDSNEKINFFNRIFQNKNITVWVGLETYVEITNNKKYQYWRWQGTKSDIRYKNWCRDSEVVKEAMCGYITLDPMCWMAQLCTYRNVMSFVCEDKQAGTAKATPPFQHYLAIPYQKTVQT